MRDPDSYYIESFALYDPSEKVSEGHNKHFHEAHKKKAIHDIAVFNHEHHAKDLLHNKEFTGYQYTEPRLIELLPTEMGSVVTMFDSLRTQMQANLDYFYKLTSPLLNHKTYDKQMEMIEKIRSNVTELIDNIQVSKDALDAYEKELHSNAEGYFKENDKNLKLSENEKNQMFEDTVTDFKQSLKLLRNKFNRVKDKVVEMNDFTKGFKEGVVKLEQVYLMSIKQKKDEIYSENNVLDKALNFDKGDIPDMAEINRIYDQIIAEERGSVVSCLMRVPNLLMLLVIGLCGVLQVQLTRMADKRRVD